MNILCMCMARFASASKTMVVILMMILIERHVVSCSKYNAAHYDDTYSLHLTNSAASSSFSQPSSAEERVKQIKHLSWAKPNPVLSPEMSTPTNDIQLGSRKLVKYGSLDTSANELGRKDGTSVGRRSKFTSINKTHRNMNRRKPDHLIRSPSIEKYHRDSEVRRRNRTVKRSTRPERVHVSSEMQSLLNSYALWRHRNGYGKLNARWG